MASGVASAPSIALSVGSNVINIVSTAQDKVTTKTYTITATRATSTDALLTSIKLALTANLFSHCSRVKLMLTTQHRLPISVSSVTVTAAEQDATANITVNGITTASGVASAPVPLNVGSNTISIVSTAQDGVTTKTYTITATTRAASTDALLTSIKTTPATSPLKIVTG